MMQTHEQHTPMSPDDRDALVGAAASSARSNQPRVLVYGGLALFILAVLYFVVSLSGYGSAMQEQRRAASALGQVKKTASELALRRTMLATEPEALVVCEPDMRITSTIQQIAIDAGLERPSVPSPKTETKGGVRRNKYSYTIQQTAVQPSALLTFVERVLEQVDCTSVTRLDLKPVRQTGWEMTVEFQRLERAP
jgi:hypothetical protein